MSDPTRHSQPAEPIQPEPTPVKPTRPKASRAQRARQVTGALAGVVVLVVGGAIVVASGDRDEAIAAQPVIPAAGAAVRESVLACPGPLRQATADSTDTDPEFSPVTESATSQVTTATLSTPDGKLPQSLLQSLDAQTLASVSAATPADAPEPAIGSGVTTQSAAVAEPVDTDGPSVLRAMPIDGQPPTTAGTYLYSANTGDLRGLASASCQPPRTDQWLVGANTTVGRTAVLTLTNPSPSPASVEVTLNGPDGPITAAAIREIAVPAEGEVPVVLDGAAGESAALAVRVRSRGAPVNAFISQSALRGVRPGGVEIITPAAAPALQQTVPAITMPPAAHTESLRADSAFDDAEPALLIAAPAGPAANITVQAWGPDGQVSLGQSGVVEAAGGAVTAVSLRELPEGTFAVTVNSDVPVTAAARTTRGSDPGDPVDFTVTGAAARLEPVAQVAVPAAGNTRLALTAPAEDATVRLRPIGANGAIGPARDVVIPAGHTVVTDPGEGVEQARAVVVDSGGGAVHAALVTTAGEGPGITTTAIPPATGAVESVLVDLRF